MRAGMTPPMGGENFTPGDHGEGNDRGIVMSTIHAIGSFLGIVSDEGSTGIAPTGGSALDHLPQPFIDPPTKFEK